MSTDSRDSRNRGKLRLNVSAENASRWTRRRDIPLAILAWIALAVVILWAAGHIIRSLLVLTIAAFLAFALVPAVKFFQRWMPRPVAILVVYLVVLTGISMLLYFIVSTAVQEVAQLANYVGKLLTPTGNDQLTPLENIVKSFGVPTDQILQARNAIISQVENLATSVAGSTIPVLQSVLGVLLDIVLVAVLSVYLLLDGGRAIGWLRNNLPLQQREQGHFVLNTLEHVVGGYIRGQLALSALIGVLVGVGMAVFQVPYAVLLGVMAFVLEFIPVLGTLISGFICVLLALTKGWLIAVLVLGYFVIVHVLEGDVIGPRIVGKAVGLHPIISLVALLAGAELFGLWGALFASPIAGLLQALLITIWKQWRERHPEQFPEEELAIAIDETIETVTPIEEAPAATHSKQELAEEKEHTSTENKSHALMREKEHISIESNPPPAEKTRSSVEDHMS